MASTRRAFTHCVGVLVIFAQISLGLQCDQTFLANCNNAHSQMLESRSTPRSTADLHLLFVTDCSAHQRWMAFNAFNSAGKAGQQGPITWLRSDCETTSTPARRLDDSKTATTLYANARIVDISGGSSGSNFNLGFGVPRALHQFLQTAGSLSNETVLALVEADMIFLSQLRMDNLKTQGLPMPNRQLIEKSGSFISPKVGVAAHYLCCDDLGPPYVLAVKDWRDLVPLWIRSGVGKGWGADQVVFAEAARAAGIHFNVFDHFMVSALSTTPAGWTLVQEALSTPAGDACATKKFGVQPGVSRLPTFMHVVKPWAFSSSDSESWGFSKYQVPPGYGHHPKEDGMLTCDMPIFAEPPSSLLGTNPADKKEKLDGWAVCTIVHSLNSMLLNYKEATCPKGFNKATALKMTVPLNWTNILLDSAMERAPHGINMTWVKSCVDDNC